MADEKPAEQTTPEYDEWVASRAAEKEQAPQDPNSREAYDEWVASKVAEKQDSETSADRRETSGDTADDERINRAVQAALAKERERVAAAAPQSFTPANAGGIGVDNPEESWSLYDQEMANRGEHPLQNQ